MAPKTNKSNKNIENLVKANKAIKDKKLAGNPVYHLFGNYYYFNINIYYFIILLF